LLFLADSSAAFSTTKTRTSRCGRTFVVHYSLRQPSLVENRAMDLKEQHPRKRARVVSSLLPLPHCIKGGSFAPLSLSGDNRTRRHAKGNWPAFVYIPLPGSTSITGIDGEDGDVEDENDLLGEARIVSRLAREASSQAGKLLPSIAIQGSFPCASTNGIVESSHTQCCSWAHMSIAKTFALRKHEIEPFLVTLREAVGEVPAFHVTISDEWCFLPSEVEGRDGKGAVIRPQLTKTGDSMSTDKSFQQRVMLDGLTGGRRGFLALDVTETESGKTGLSKLVAAVDNVMQRFGKEKYFDPAHFHVTFAEVSAAAGSFKSEKFTPNASEAPCDVHADVSAEPETISSSAMPALEITEKDGERIAKEPTALQHLLRGYNSSDEESIGSCGDGHSADSNSMYAESDRFAVFPVHSIYFKTGSKLNQIKLRALA